MEKVIFFALAVPILGFVFYLGGTAIMKGFKAKVENKPAKPSFQNFYLQKKKTLMMPKNHFDTQYNYYDSVQNSTSIISSDPWALFHNQEQKYKVEK